MLSIPDVAPQQRFGQGMFTHSVITASAGRDSQADARSREALWFCCCRGDVVKTLVLRAD